jgi:hypothetical protein
MIPAPTTPKTRTGSGLVMAMADSLLPAGGRSRQPRLLTRPPKRDRLVPVSRSSETGCGGWDDATMKTARALLWLLLLAPVVMSASCVPEGAPPQTGQRAAPPQLEADEQDSGRLQVGGEIRTRFEHR